MLEEFKDSREELNKKLNQVFPEGKVVTFKHGNMQAYQEATIESACITLGSPEVLLTNNVTGKRRWISLYAVPEEYWEE